jgi:hypothetical protein
VIVVVFCVSFDIHDMKLMLRFKQQLKKGKIRWLHHSIVLLVAKCAMVASVTVVDGFHQVA